MSDDWIKAAIEDYYAMPREESRLVLQLNDTEEHLRNAQALIKYIAGIPPGTMQDVPEFWAEIQYLCRLNDEKYVKFMRGKA